MPNRRIDVGLKFAAVRMYERKILSLDDILDVVDFSKSTFFRYWFNYKQTGSPAKPKSNHLGRPRIVLRDDIDYIMRLVRLRPDWFGVELLRLLEHNRFLSIHFSTIFRELKRQGISRKRLCKIASERNETVRSDFIRRMAAEDAATIGFIDETSKDEQTWAPRYGYSKKGHHATIQAPFVRGTRLSGTALLSIDGVVASTVCEGSMTRARFLEWLEFDVVSSLANTMDHD
jgi:transposase